VDRLRRRDAWSMRKPACRCVASAASSTRPCRSGQGSVLGRARDGHVLGPRRPAPEAGPGAMAAVAQRGENLYVGVNCGIMDQLPALPAARARAHDRLPDEHVHAVPCPRAGGVVCDTGSTRRLTRPPITHGARNATRGEAHRRARAGVTSLRDVDEAMLERNRDRLPSRGASMRAHRLRGRPGRGHGRGDARRYLEVLRRCSPPRTRPCVTCSRSARASSTPWSR